MSFADAETINRRVRLWGVEMKFNQHQTQEELPLQMLEMQLQALTESASHFF